MAITERKLPLMWYRVYYGLSTDPKPTDVPIGSRFTETNTGNTYETADGTIWSLIFACGASMDEVPISINAINASETNFLNLAVSGKHYRIDSLVLKSADPGANTVNIKLYRLVNAVLTNTNTFAITTANFTSYFNLVQMFLLDDIAGDNIKITVQATAGGPYAVTGSYVYRVS